MFSLLMEKLLECLKHRNNFGLAKAFLDLRSWRLCLASESSRFMFPALICILQPPHRERRLFHFLSAWITARKFSRLSLPESLFLAQQRPAVSLGTERKSSKKTTARKTFYIVLSQIRSTGVGKGTVEGIN